LTIACRDFSLPISRRLGGDEPGISTYEAPMKLDKILEHCRVSKPGRFRLADCDPAETFRLAIDKEDVKATLADGIARLADLQERLYAQDRWAVLVVLQAMDAAGKDGVIKHVMSGVNPQGCEVHAFKAPSDEELQHDFLWRAAIALPRRGQIGIFNRSYYEEVLVVRVHSDLLAQEKLPPDLIGKDIWKQRFKAIRAFEHHLVRNGTLVLKFHLRISKEEQRRRFLARISEPAKRWKFSMSDAREREYWGDYMAAYQDMIRETSTPYAPWYVVPSDHKPVAWAVVAAAIVDGVDRLDLKRPKVSGAKLKELASAEKVLPAEAPGKARQRKSVARKSSRKPA
jgi:PPK2 family polyphosphate:nucleotide phosphotransferase